MDFFYSLELLFCTALLLTVLFLFQKVAINNTLISKEFVILCCEINKCIIIVITVIIPQTIIVPTKSIIVASLQDKQINRRTQ